MKAALWVAVMMVSVGAWGGSAGLAGYTLFRLE